VRRRFLAHRLLFAWLLAIVGSCVIAVTRTTSAEPAQVSTSVGPPFALHAIGDVQKLPWPNVGEDPSVTPVAGSSWLTHLGISLRQTNLGQGAERYGPAPGQDRPARDESLSVPGTVQINGADLYRLNCQACHRAEGTGAPPEIHSLLAAVQGSSLALVRARLQQRTGQSAEPAARAQASRARADVLARMHKGGLRMPPRDYLQEEDMRMLFAYLTHLAAAPDEEHQSTRVVSWARRGELVVKGTCHICHDAVGPRPSESALLRGAVPSLESVLKTKSVSDFVHKARKGEVVSYGEPWLRHRGRMPVFYYLRDEEVASAYVYLATYPPRPARP
jgi:mono/diheme cytochrome c family protein